LFQDDEANIMSDKHLMELPWKVLVAKQGVKDIGLGKALASYSNLDAVKEPAKALEALKEAAELAIKLKKANSTKEDVVDYLDEVVKEVKRTTPVLDARIKSATAAAAPKTADAAKPTVAAEEEDEDEEEDEEKEAAEFKKDLKKQMVSALAQVKARAPGEPEQQKDPKPQLQFMAYIAGKTSAVVVARKVGSATKKLLPEIAGGAGGGRFVQGECIFEKNVHTFVLEKVPGGLAKSLAKALFAETGARYKARVRSTDGSTELDSDTDTDPEDIPTASPQPSGQPAGDPGAAYHQRLAAITPSLQRALRDQLGDPGKIRAVAEFAREKAGAGNYDSALKALDALEKLPAAAVAPPAREPAATPARGATAAPASGIAPAPSQIKLSTYLSGRTNLRAARDSAAKELQRLHQAILAKAADEPFFQEVEARSQKLFDYLAPIDDAVVNKLEEAGKCPDPELQAGLNEKVRDLIQKQLAALRAPPLASFVEKNPFGKFIIKQPLEVTLSALDKQLS
jgi:hypothetical protein